MGAPESKTTNLSSASNGSPLIWSDTSSIKKEAHPSTGKSFETLVFPAENRDERLKRRCS
jgi:hypothetical protein